MSGDAITLQVNPPEPVVIARILEVACGASYVTIRQVMGRTTDEWSVYEGDARGSGLVGQVNHAPRTPTSEELIPWAADLVARREHARIARAALAKLVDDQPHPPVTDDDDQPEADQG